MRAALTTAMLAGGIALLAVAGLASGSTSAGGTLRVNLASDFDYVDPALAHTGSSWQLLQAACAQLVTYPDWIEQKTPQLVPEVAAALPLVSRDGRTYTFTLRGDYRFSTGAKVTPAAFARALERALDPKLSSPASVYAQDVAGSKAMLAGTATSLTGVAAHGSTLTIRLTKPAPDFLARLAMPYFCAVPPDLPATPRGVGAPLPSAGPFYLADWTPARSALLKRNPYYRGPRTASLDEIAFTLGVPSASSLLQVQKGEADLGPLPPTAHTELYRTHGLGKRYFVKPGLTLIYLALNTERPLFGNARLRKAVNFALDRPELVRQYGFLGGRRTDQWLPFGMPGFRDVDAYPLKGADVVRAQALVGNLGGTRAILLAGNRGSSPLAAQVVQYNLAQIGIDVEVRLLDPGVLVQRLGTRGDEWDIGIAGWSVDYADPYAFLNVLFDGRRIGPANNTNLSYLNSDGINERLAAAASLDGDARYAAYAKLDADLTRDLAPGAPYIVLNTRVFVSERVGCVTFVPLAGLSLAALCVK